ncbi:BTB/POZ and MATH domain-containing protein 3-like [Triticum aestivum]|uniref:BTB/POZ and MATH domain-containing protein 3-like n=1 Tax=Triticum aestivum TaxID=4565 RepID=UPI001D009C46|nr:BTB/POZ and MATH domain-containing protein 3-like [Triticum aestivum]
MATQHKTASTHRSAIVRGVHQLDIVGYSTRRMFGADNTIRSRSFDAGGFVWALVCRFVAKPEQARGLTLASISIELSRNQTDEDVVAMASVRIDDPTGCGRYPGAEWHSAEPHIFPARSRKAVAWELSVPDMFLEHQERYVMDDCLTIHCTVDVIREESVDGTTRNYSVVVPPPPSLSQDIHRLRQEMWWPDVTFVVDQTKIQAHKLVLAMRSPVFAAQFHGEMKEKTMRSLRIDDMSASTFNAMLHFIYTDELAQTNKGTCHLAMVRDLLVAADLYDLERLRLMCENILSKSITVGNVMSTLMLVHNRHSCRQLEASCVEFIASDPDIYNAVQATNEYKELEKECPSFIYEITKKLATRAVARNKSPSTSSTGCGTDSSRESVSRYNPSAVMIGTHEFRIESLKAIRKTHSGGQYIQSGSFQVGGYEWAISVYPSGFEGDETEYIGLFLRRLSYNNDDEDADDDNDDGGGNNDAHAVDAIPSLSSWINSHGMPIS